MEMWVAYPQVPGSQCFQPFGPATLPLTLTHVQLLYQCFQIQSFLELFSSPQHYLLLQPSNMAAATNPQTLFLLLYSFLQQGHHVSIQSTVFSGLMLALCHCQGFSV